MTSVPTAAYGSAERALCDQSSSDRLSVFCQGSKQTKQRQAGRGDNAFRESAVCLRDVGVTVMASRQRPGLSSATSATINNNIQQAQTGSRLLPRLVSRVLFRLLSVAAATATSRFRLRACPTESYSRARAVGSDVVSKAGARF